MSREVDLDQAIMAARQHYAVLPYHGWHHAVEVMENVDILLQQVVNKELKAARKALIIAAAWHDTEYTQDHTALGFESKEKYSAVLAWNYLQTVEADDTTIGLVTNGILATEHKARRTTDEERVLHGAGMRNIGWLYPAFRRNAVNLWDEDAQLNGTRQPWEQWRENTLHFIDFSVDEARDELGRLGITLGMPGSFDTLALDNRRRFAQELEPRQR